MAKKPEFTEEEIHAYFEHDDRDDLVIILTNIIQGTYSIEHLKKNIKKYIKQ